MISVLDDSTKVLDSLISIRSQLEGTSVDFPKTHVSEEVLQKLRQLLLMHTPSSLTDEVRQQFSRIVSERLLSGQFSHV